MTVDTPLQEQIGHVSEQLASTEALADHLRKERDSLFVAAYDARAISVTEMGKLSGLRRESVHEAINRTKKGSA